MIGNVYEDVEEGFTVEVGFDVEIGTETFTTCRTTVSADYEGFVPRTYWYDPDNYLSVKVDNGGEVTEMSACELVK